MSFICSHEAAPGFKVTALSHELSLVIWCYCLTNQYPLWENLAGFYDKKPKQKGSLRFRAEMGERGFLSSRLTERRREKLSL